MLAFPAKKTSTPSCFIYELNPHQAFLYPYHRIILSASSTMQINLPKLQRQSIFPKHKQPSNSQKCCGFLLQEDIFTLAFSLLTCFFHQHQDHENQNSLWCSRRIDDKWFSCAAETQRRNERLFLAPYTNKSFLSFKIRNRSRPNNRQH